MPTEKAERWMAMISYQNPVNTCIYGGEMLMNMSIFFLGGKMSFGGNADGGPVDNGGKGKGKGKEKAKAKAKGKGKTKGKAKGKAAKAQNRQVAVAEKKLLVEEKSEVFTTNFAGKRRQERQRKWR